MKLFGWLPHPPSGVLRITAGGAAWLVPAGAALFAGLYLGLVRDALIGETILLLLTILAIARLPWRWALGMAGIGLLALLAVQAHHSFGTLRGGAAWLDLARGASLFVFVAAMLALVRSRAQAIADLRAAQTRLTAEMALTARLAAAQERARIARDLHDVLSHSLTVVSVQIQAARQLAISEPEQLAARLDIIAGLVRDSIAESRHVVNLLRDDAETRVQDGTPGAALRELAERFSARTGVDCVWHERGAARSVTAAQAEALHFALQEALTNALRHGNAQHITIDLAWEATTVSLSARDDGSGEAAGVSGEALEYVGGGHGLRGLRERAAELGGVVNAGSHPAGGFTLILTLPLTSLPEVRQ